MARRDREAKKINQLLDELAKFIQVVKTEYEMYFMGIQTNPPTQKERELKVMIRELTEMGITNTAMRFKLKTLKSRYNTLRILWLRSCKQIEEGTYKRHRVLASIRDRQKQREEAEKRKPKVDVDGLKAGVEAATAGEDADSVATVRAETIPDPDTTEGRNLARSAAPRKRRSSGHQVGSRSLMQEYSSVRESLGMSGRVDAKALEARLRKHAESVKARTGARDVRFRVVAEDGKAKLKAVAIK